jgi:hypothetical protein
MKTDTSFATKSGHFHLLSMLPGFPQYALNLKMEGNAVWSVIYSCVEAVGSEDEKDENCLTIGLGAGIAMKFTTHTALL